ncbi:hypothetical protein RRG08_029413 [Elysia crispata]|uniref:Uncharacterized protein n=1 Tax=Elysia crispata TaxID=231223 RepID=A0AAE0Z076_9GAST|nr:hypothetical protein RRG08_029413 [Elysia crispata]
MQTTRRPALTVCLSGVSGVFCQLRVLRPIPPQRHTVTGVRVEGEKHEKQRGKLMVQCKYKNSVATVLRNVLRP